MTNPIFVPEDQLPHATGQAFNAQLLIISILVVFGIGPMVAVGLLYGFFQVAAAFGGR